MDIKELRAQIDEIDAQLLELFRARMNVSLGVAEYKRERNMAVYDPARERALLANVNAMAGEEMGGYATSLYKTIMELSRTYQHHILEPKPQIKEYIETTLDRSPRMLPKYARVACQGVEGAYSQIAATRMFDNPVISYYGDFADIFRAVAEGECDFGVLPIENSTAGSVNRVYDLLKKNSQLIVKSTRIKIDHNLLAKRGVEKSEIKEIFSHEQALNQCSAFLKSHPEVKVTVCENTAAAAKYVSESGRRDIAAICSRECGALYGLTIVKSNVQDENSNYTRFICISKDFNVFAGSQKISIMTTIPHVPGSLNKLLGKFSMQGLNLTKLESRPLAKHNFEFMFYFDFEGSIENEGVLNLIAELENSSEHFVFLGSYAEMTV